jgi:hypothetical protein
LSTSLPDLFLTLLPKIELHGRIVFRHLKCCHKRQDAIAEMVALIWKWCVRPVERGKGPSQFPTTLATFATRAVIGGRRVPDAEC